MPEEIKKEDTALLRLAEAVAAQEARYDEAKDAGSVTKINQIDQAMGAIFNHCKTEAGESKKIADLLTYKKDDKTPSLAEALKYRRNRYDIFHRKTDSYTGFMDEIKPIMELRVLDKALARKEELIKVDKPNTAIGVLYTAINKEYAKYKNKNDKGSLKKVKLLEEAIANFQQHLKDFPEASLEDILKHKTATKGSLSLAQALKSV